MATDSSPMAMPATSNHEPRETTVQLPGSKSIAARALILKRVFDLPVTLKNMPVCDDTRELAEALQIYDSRPDNEVHINIGNGGTSLRFFLALAASTPGFRAVIDCGEQLRHRPHAPLISALRAAGAEITCLDTDMQPPLRVSGKRLSANNIKTDLAASSQFASALILVSPLWNTPWSVPYNENIASRPYLEMSLKLLRHFTTLHLNNSTAEQLLNFKNSYTIESDWSAAAFFYEYARLHPGVIIRLPNLTVPEQSLQGDSAAASLFGKLGVRTTFNPDGSATITCEPDRHATDGTSIMDASCDVLRFDMQDTPDLVPALATAACMSHTPFVMTGVKNLRFKESDRIASLTEELSKAGHRLHSTEDSLSLNPEEIHALPGHTPQNAGIITYDSHTDHRIAMALAAAGIPPAQIKDFRSVSKSFPDFEARLRTLKP